MLPPDTVVNRLRAAGVHFTQPPVAMGPVTTAVLDDTCGNLIQIAEIEFTFEPEGEAIEARK